MDKSQPSAAPTPDLDWSQITETVRMLNLAVAQISLAMHEGEDSVASLSNHFTSMVSHVNDIGDVVRTLDGGAETEQVKGQILTRCAEVQGHIQQNIVAFQFYDRLSQRLDHVRETLAQLSELVADRSRLFNPGEWSALQGAIRSRYTMQEEQDMFDALQQGESIDEALEQVRGKLMAGEIDDIELF
jgi:hypothetical protein